MKKGSDKIIAPWPQLDDTSVFLPYMKTIEDAIKDNKISVDELIKTLSYTHFMMLAYDIKTELADALTLSSTEYKTEIEEFLKTFDTMTKEEFKRRKEELWWEEYEIPSPVKQTSNSKGLVNGVNEGIEKLMERIALAYQNHQAKKKAKAEILERHIKEKQATLDDLAKKLEIFDNIPKHLAEMLAKKREEESRVDLSETPEK